MSPEEIFEKAKTGDLSKDELNAMVTDLAPDEQIRFRNLAAQEAKETLSQMTALRQEKNRVESKIKEGEQAPAPTPDPMQKFRDEQLLKAKIKFQQDFKISDADLATIEENFSKVDSGKIDAELIYKDFVGAYALANSESLIEAQRNQNQMRNGAVAATAASAGTVAGEPGGTQPRSEIPADVQQIAKEAGISDEAAMRVATEGFKRVY